MSKAFASAGDLEDKVVSFTQLAPGCYAYTAEGDPNSGIIIGEDGVMVIDTQATPEMAADVLARVRAITDKPVKYVVLSHYHAVRVLGASAYEPQAIIASRDTYDLIVERGAADMASEIGRFPRLFRGVDSIPGLTWPTIVFENKLTVQLGGLEVEILQVGRGHTKGDTVVWVPEHKVMYAGDLVEYGATPYTGDAHLEDWPATLDNLATFGAEKLVPGRGDALTNAAQVADAIAGTRAFVSDLFQSVKAAKDAGKSLNDTYRTVYAELKQKYGNWVIFDHCMPFDVTRAYDEAGGLSHPRIWTDERDQAMWKELEG